MLITSLTKNSDEVVSDILTHGDLVKMTSKQSTTNSKIINANLQQKRYLIITYLTTYDKIHYPLSLNYIEEPSCERTRLTIRRLSQELELYSSQRAGETSIKEIMLLKHENDVLKAKIRNQGF
eukprot:GHVR01067582.1.p1 GENE.GHVR01067582.1~~GHVR01067582.1.p1  ORF type:complete len:123 (+),score=1.28 GHVR01067582.1:631-999(+)